jgi:hypothetical protein
MRIGFGALSPKISEQAKANGWVATGECSLVSADLFAHSINMLRIHGVITSGEFDRAAARLLKMLALKPDLEVSQ